MRKGWLILWIVCIFLIGYYLRAYNEIHHDLPLSPYHTYGYGSYNPPNYSERIPLVETNITLLSNKTNSNAINDTNTFPHVDKTNVLSLKEIYNVFRGELVLFETEDFSDKTRRYPTTAFIGSLFSFVDSFYIIYLFGFIALFLLGRVLTGKNLGGILAASLFAISPENMLFVTTNVSNSGLAYVLTWFSLWFLYKYFTSKKLLFLVLFTGIGLLVLTSYHTGATAFVMLILGLVLSMIYAKFWNYKFYISVIILSGFHIFWIYFFDISQYVTIRNALLSYYTLLFMALLVGGYFILPYLSINSKKWISYLPLIMLFPATILIFSPYHFFLHPC